MLNCTAGRCTRRTGLRVAPRRSTGLRACFVRIVVAIAPRRVVHSSLIGSHVRTQSEGRAVWRSCVRASRVGTDADCTAVDTLQPRRRLDPKVVVAKDEFVDSRAACSLDRLDRRRRNEETCPVRSRNNRGGAPNAANQRRRRAYRLVKRRLRRSRSWSGANDEERTVAPHGRRRSARRRRSA